MLLATEILKAEKAIDCLRKSREFFVMQPENEFQYLYDQIGYNVDQYEWDLNSEVRDSDGSAGYLRFDSNDLKDLINQAKAVRQLVKAIKNLHISQGQTKYANPY